MSEGILGPYARYINIAVDLRGTQASTWGTQDSYKSPIEFHPPDGLRTRILHVEGDYVAWVKGDDPADPATAILRPGQSCEYGWGLKTSAPDFPTDGLVTYPGYSAVPYSNTLCWMQGSVDYSNPRDRIEYKRNVSLSGLLEADNILFSQSFVALNLTGKYIHAEPTFRIIFQFEPIS